MFSRSSSFYASKMSDHIPFHSISDFKSIIASRGSRTVNLQLRIVSHADETDGGRCSWMVEDTEDETFKTFMVCFHGNIEGFVNVIRCNHVYNIFNARVNKDKRPGTHYPFRIVIDEKSTVEEQDLEEEASQYSFCDFSDVQPDSLPMKHVDLGGKIVGLEDNFSITHNGNFKKLHLEDENGKLVQLLVWKDDASHPITNKWQAGQVMLIKGALVTGDKSVRGKQRNIRVIGVADELEEELGPEALERIEILMQE
jgi:hypothetical protein